MSVTYQCQAYLPDTQQNFFKEAHIEACASYYVYMYVNTYVVAMQSVTHL